MGRTAPKTSYRDTERVGCPGTRVLLPLLLQCWSCCSGCLSLVSPDPPTSAAPRPSSPHREAVAPNIEQKRIATILRRGGDIGDDQEHPGAMKKIQDTCLTNVWFLDTCVDMHLISSYDACGKCCMFRTCHPWNLLLLINIPPSGEMLRRIITYQCSLNYTYKEWQLGCLEMPLGHQHIHPLKCPEDGISLHTGGHIRLLCSHDPMRFICPSGWKCIVV